nr:hypothetical protein [Tanacetum cinerariifolium]
MKCGNYGKPGHNKKGFDKPKKQDNPPNEQANPPSQQANSLSQQANLSKKKIMPIVKDPINSRVPSRNKEEGEVIVAQTGEGEGEVLMVGEVVSKHTLFDEIDSVDAQLDEELYTRDHNQSIRDENKVVSNFNVEDAVVRDNNEVVEHDVNEPTDQFQEDPPVAMMIDNRTIAEMLHAPAEGYAEAIVVPPILAEQFELKHSLINMMTSEQFFGLKKDNPHDHIVGAARRWLENEPPHSITTWEDLVSKFINEFFPPSRTTSLRNEISNFEPKFSESFHEAWDRYKDLLRACPHHGFTELHQLNTFYNALNTTDQDSLNAAAGNLLERSTQDVLTIIENKSKVRNSRSKSIASQVKACDTNSSSEIAKLTHAVNEQTSAMITAITAMLRQFQATPPLASVKDVKETCVTCEGAHPYYQCLAAGGNTFPEFRDNIQEYGS